LVAESIFRSAAGLVSILWHHFRAEDRADGMPNFRRVKKFPVTVVRPLPRIDYQPQQLLHTPLFIQL